MNKKLFSLSLVTLSIMASSVYADLQIAMNLLNADGSETAIGTITASRNKCGVILTPNLHDLTPGVHGFHLHQKPSCADQGMAAGAHYDPQKSNKHDGPYAAKGHLGDLPVLIVNKDGTATTPVLAPRLSLQKLKGHALMIHVGGDNYADQPEKLGGGGARMACGVIAAN